MNESTDRSDQIVACVVLPDPDTEQKSDHETNFPVLLECYWCGHSPCGCGG